MKINYYALQALYQQMLGNSPSCKTRTKFKEDLIALNYAERACVMIIAAELAMQKGLYNEDLLFTILDANWDDARAGTARAVIYAIEHGLVLEFNDDNDEFLTDDGNEVFIASIHSSNKVKTIGYLTPQIN